jgi:hypothetical protein
MECTTTYKSEGKTYTNKLWVKGESIRSEMDTEAGKAVVIMKGKKIYSKITPPIQGMDCVWWLIETNETTSTTATQIDTTTVSDPNLQVVCHPSAFGDDKFEVVGKTCSMEDLMKQYQIPNVPTG